MASSWKLIIGIDFGTTYSGVSWFLHKDGGNSDQPHVVTRWPSKLAFNQDRQKVPSKIYYDKDTGNTSWGYDIPSEVEPLEWFKLLLLEDDDIPPHLKKSTHLQDAKRIMLSLGKDATEVTGDYLKLLWGHALKAIERTKGPSVIKGSPISVVLTIPAIWKDYARDRMRRAAELAGILDKRPYREDTTLQFVTEPEAAVMATLSDLKIGDGLADGDSFVVCDCGGGTVDIISYTVNQAQPLVVRECVEGDGDLCGAVFLDEEFQKFIKERFPGGKRVWNMIKPSEMDRFMNSYWEHAAKRQFDGTDGTWAIDLPKKSKRTILEVTSSDLRDIFNDVTTRITRLVDDQIMAVKRTTSKDPKYIILVGGFGRCPFIHASLLERYQGIYEILQSDGDGPWSVVCRGATISGALGHGLLNEGVRVQSRVSRLSYGWKFREVFVEGKHHIEDKSWCDLERCWKAKNQMNWAIKRGNDVETNHAKSFPYHRLYSAAGTEDQKQSKKIYSSTSPMPSSRYGSGEDFQLVERLKWELPVPVEDLPITRSSNRNYRRFDYKIQMEVSGASLDLQAVADGKVLGCKNLEVETT